MRRILIAIVTGLIALPTMAAEDVYYCAERIHTGALYDQGTKRYEERRFNSQKLKVVIKETIIEIQEEDGSDYEVFCKVTGDTVMFCFSPGSTFNFNKASLEFIYARTFGNIIDDEPNKEGDPISISVGNCSKNLSLHHHDDPAASFTAARIALRSLAFTPLRAAL